MSRCNQTAAPFTIEQVFILSIYYRCTITFPLSQALWLPQERYGIGLKKIGKKNVHTVWKMYLLHSFMDEIWDSNVIQRWVFHRMRQQRLSSSHSLLGTLQGHSHCIITLWTLTYFLMTMPWVISVHHTPDTSIPAGIWKKLNTRACSILTSLIQFSFNNNNKSLLI